MSIYNFNDIIPRLLLIVMSEPDMQDTAGEAGTNS